MKHESIANEQALCPPTSHAANAATGHSEQSDCVSTVRRGAVATIGFFDGVHLGHQWLIRQVKSIAQERSLDALIVTFSEHPVRVLHPELPVRLLTTSAEKEALLLNQGVDRVVMLPFTRQLTALSAHDFMRDVLQAQYDVRVLVIGYDHRFGHNRAEGFDDYAAYGRELGIEVVAAEELPDSAGKWSGAAGGVLSAEGASAAPSAGRSALSGVYPDAAAALLLRAGGAAAELPAAQRGSISSSYIRQLLTQGEVFVANHWLGHPYQLSGRVVEGHQVGREIGFPTANVHPDDALKLVPQRGVYAVRVLLADGRRYAGMLNIGHRPTLRNGHDESIEVYLLDFSGNLYGEHLTLQFYYFLRPERPFESVEELSRQLRKDEARVRRLLADCDSD